MAKTKVSPTTKKIEQKTFSFDSTARLRTARTVHRALFRIETDSTAAFGRGYTFRRFDGACADQRAVKTLCIIFQQENYVSETKVSPFN